MKTETFLACRDIMDELCWHNWKGRDVFCPFDDGRSPFVAMFRKHFNDLNLSSLMWSSLDEPSLKVTNDGVSVREVPQLFSGFWSSDVRYKLRHFKNLVVVSQPPARISKRVLDALVESDARFLIAGCLDDIIPVGGNNTAFSAYCQGSLSTGYTSEDIDPRQLPYYWWTNLPHEDPKSKPQNESWSHTQLVKIDTAFQDTDAVTGAGVFLTYNGADRSNMELVEIPLCEIGRVDRTKFSVLEFRDYVKSESRFGYNYLLLKRKSR